MINKPDIDSVRKKLPDVQIIDELGSGGFKVVYKAVINGNTEALKLVQIPADPNDAGIKEENIKRIFREISILNQCESPFLVKLGSVKLIELSICDCDYVAYSEEYLPGETLRQLIDSGHKPDFDELCELSIVLFKAIIELASKNFIHRDIKPDNIIKTGLDGRSYVLLDFGIAFHIGGSNLTRDALRVPGTLYYIAPEMLDAGFRQNLDYRADLYTIGLTLYEYATGFNPYANRGEAQFTTLYRIKSITPQPLSSICPDLPHDFCLLVDNLMKKLPALRPANIGMLIKKIEALL